MKFFYKEDITKYKKDRNIVLFGSGNIAEKTKRIINSEVYAIADNSQNLWGSKNLGIEVINPNKLKKNNNKYFVIICTTSYSEVVSQLEKYEYKIEEDFIISPILNDLRIIDEFENYKKKIIFTSGSPPDKNKEFGGGIYQILWNKDKWKCEKKISGNCYGLIRYKNNFVAIDTDLGIFEFDQNFRVIRTKKLQKSSRSHGLSYSSKRKEFYVVCSYLDSILILNEDFKLKSKISISKKLKYNKYASHHCNDCEYNNNHLYVSMFSETGNWKNDVYDGCILEIDLIEKKINKPIIQNLWMPHNPKVIQGSFYVNDSLKGNLLGNNFNVIGNFPAFTRGLDHDGNFFYIGQSKNRNYSKNIGLSKNISIDTGIIVFDEKTKISKFLQISSKISEIHSVIAENL
mgnify:FL=1